MWARRLAASSLLFAIVAFSFLPIQDKRALHTKGRLHLWGHFAAFAAVTSIVLVGWPTRKARVALLPGLLAVAVSIELTQHALYKSPVEVADVVCDGLGILCGGCLAAARPKGQAPHKIPDEA